MAGLHKVAFILLIVGGLNWLLTGFFSTWDLASFVGGGIARLIYVLVGISAVLEVIGHKKMCKGCAPSGGAPGASM